MAIYSDVNSLDPTTKPQLVDVESVYQSLYNLFNTTPGERLFLPEYGIDLEDELFEPMDDATSLEIERRVLEATGRWESRVSVNNADTAVTPDYDNNKYDLFLVFDIQGIEGQSFTFVGSFTK